MINEQKPITSATRSAKVVFGMYLSTQAVFRLDRKPSAGAVSPNKRKILLKTIEQLFLRVSKPIF